MDTLTGFTTVYFDYPVGVPLLQGLASNTDNIFYAMAEPFISTDLYKIDVNNGTVVNLGATGHQCGGDLTFFDGELYFTNTQMGHSYVEVVKVDINNPGNSEVVTTYSSAYPTQGVTASNICNTLIITAGFVPNEMLYFLNLLDGTLTPICDVPGPPDELWYLSSKLELGSPTICNVAIDLDCDDSSGATDADYNSHDYDCLSNGVKISDNDIGMLYDAIISSMTIQITGFVPDAPNEILMMTGSVAGINVSGSGTDMITLTNAGGAKSTDFKDALRLIVYKNTAI
ncbi:MAG: hypothetical protein ABJC12_12995, partial [Saprospiraceae bacterium]